MNSTLCPQMQNNQMETSATDPSHDIPSTGISGHRVVDIVDEYVEREQHKCNLLIHYFQKIYPLLIMITHVLMISKDLVSKEFNINDPN